MKPQRALASRIPGSVQFEVRLRLTGIAHGLEEAAALNPVSANVEKLATRKERVAESAHRAIFRGSQ